MIFGLTKIMTRIQLLSTDHLRTRLGSLSRPLNGLFMVQSPVRANTILQQGYVILHQKKYAMSRLETTKQYKESRFIIPVIPYYCVRVKMCKSINGVVLSNFSNKFTQGFICRSKAIFVDIMF